MAHSVALGNDGNAYAFGSNYNGALGNNNPSVTESFLPVQVVTPPGIKFTQVKVGTQRGNHSLGLGDDGYVYSWGSNLTGQLGLGDTTARYKPTKIPMPAGVTRFTKIAAGANFSLALASNGKVYAWGSNTVDSGFVGGGQLGVGDSNSRSTPTLVTALPSSATITDISSLTYKSAAIGSDGTIYLWGPSGQPSNSALSCPPPAGYKYNSVTVGDNTYSATATDGNTYMWGSTSKGQFGDGTGNGVSTPSVNAPTVVHPLMPAGVHITKMSRGSAFTVALGDNGKAYAWGEGAYGQLGNQATSNQWRASGTPGDNQWVATPIEVDQPAGVLFTDIAASYNSSFALGNDGNTYGWGLNGFGLLGHGTGITYYESPVRVGGDVRITKVTFDTTVVSGSINTVSGSWTGKSPAHTAGTINVYVEWSIGGVAQPTDTLRYLYLPPFTVHFDLGAASGHTSSPAPADQIISAGENKPIKYPNPTPTWEHHWFTGWTTNGTDYWDFTKPVTSSMTLTAKWEEWSFTLNPAVGPASGGNTVNITPPSPPNGIVYQQISAGYYLSLAIGSDGNTYAWGNNQYGQLGDNTTTNRKLPVKVHTPTNVHFTAISAGGYHALALGDDGNVYAWGLNRYGQLGDGTTIDKHKPVAVHNGALPTGQHFTTISAGFYHSAALGTNYEAYAWGLNNHGQLGDGTTSNSAHESNGTPSHTSANKTEPVLTHHGELPTNERFTSISAGYWHTLATGSDHRSYSWGFNSSGQLGNGIRGNTNTINDIPVGYDGDQSEPILIHDGALPSSEHFIAVSAGGYHSLALGSDGQIYSWGENNMGQIGDGTTYYVKLEPVLVHHGALPASERFTTISAGGAHNLATGSDGKTYAWGWNAYDQIGDGSDTDKSEPVLTHSGALQATGRFTTISAGGWHNLAIGTDKHTYAWGWNDGGLLGDSTTLDRNEPIQVGLQELLVAGITFDQTEATPAPIWDSTNETWKVSAPAHNPGQITTNIHWTLDGIAQADYSLPYTYQWNLPTAGAIPLRRLTGASFIALTSLATVVCASHEISKHRQRTQGKHSTRPMPAEATR
ncbi:hypothetical protein KIMH_12300 [Bombiscardovia apis]|uniref:RCC1-like domain-containing protein n=2 Tax=Bombiscardovia apis TaxID=2932182 RepID=A0ABM8BDW7_9BIFI|nr:hypothetical protein [Bombiscardovia apis]BDR55119.1 hypothetical protein KIMH_12300 [Bombiscardovia apis]